MTDYTEIGKIYRMQNEDQFEFEWKIINLFSTTESGTWHRSHTFFVAGASWFLSIWYVCTNYVVLRLDREIPEEYFVEVEYSFAFKEFDGSVKQFGRGFIERGERFSEEQDFDLDYPSKDINIRCIVRRKMTHSTQPTVLHETKPLTLISLDKLSEKFKDLLGNKETCDTTLKVKDKEYKAHRAILIAQSPVFAAMFVHDTSERQTGVVDIPDCDPDSFREFLEYLYCGKLEDISFRSALHLYVTSDKYAVQELKAFCVEYLMQCLTVENICKVVVFADQYDEVELFSAAQSFFNENVKNILKTSEWECLLKKDYRLANKLLIEMANVKH